MRSGILRQNSSLLDFSLRIIDLVMLLSLGFIAHVIYIGDHIGLHYIIAFMLASSNIIIIFSYYKIYRSWRGISVSDEIKKLALAWSMVIVLLVVLAFITKTSEDFSRLWIILWWMLGLSGFVVSRLALRFVLSWMRANRYNIKRIVLVGDADIAKQVEHQVAKNPWTGFQVLGFFGESVTQNHSSESLQCLGTTSVMPEYLAQQQIDEVWITYGLSHDYGIRSVLERLKDQTIDVRYVPDLFGLQLLNRSVSEIAGMPVINLSLSPMESLNRFTKGGEDYVLGLLIVLFTLPAMIFIAMAVKLTSPGPVLFKQTRLGWGGRQIEVWKFRTMVVHQEESGQVTQARKDDPRLTWIGSFLRRTSLDELPQFINVLQGRMSIVGPRPHALTHNEYRFVYSTSNDIYRLGG